MCLHVFLVLDLSPCVSSVVLFLDAFLCNSSVADVVLDVHLCGSSVVLVSNVCQRCYVVNL